MINHRQINGSLSGAVTNTENNTRLRNIHVQTDDNLEKQLKMFWQIEEVPEGSTLSEEEKLCEAHYVNNITQLPNGSYQVKLPRRDSMPNQ